MSDPVLAVPAEPTETVETVTCACGADFPQRILTVPGAPRAWRFPGRCAKCQAEHNALVATRVRDLDARRESEQLRLRLGELEIPPLYADVDFSTFQLHGTPEEKALLAEAKHFAQVFVECWPESPVTIAAFVGAPGSGKGHLVWSIAKAVLAKGSRARVVKLADLIRSLRRTWRDDAKEDEGKVLARYRTPDLLVIDEVSRHAFFGQQIHQHLYDVLDHRLEHQRHTIITSNESEAGLAEILRPALFNRIAGNGGLLDFGTASWRSRPRD